MQNILVTGAGSGIGLKTVQLLAKKGFHVFAGARKLTAIESLQAIPDVTGIRLDVCEPQDLDNLVKILEKNENGLFGVVNNAGIANLGPLYAHKMEELHRIFEVNLFGLHRIITAIFPYLLKSKGRIVNISSMSGIMTGPMIGLYSMSKYAVEAYSEGLFYDLKDKGINVSMIEPGNFQSKMGENMITHIRNQGMTDRQFMTKKDFDQMFVQIRNYVDSDSNNPEPDPVADAVFDALTSNSPKLRYLVGSPEEIKMAIERMFQKISQLNDQHEITLSREELIAIMDKNFRPN
jgi:short-subunit dehydrogenase